MSAAKTKPAARDPLVQEKTPDDAKRVAAAEREQIPEHTPGPANNHESANVH
jgi:hypothetical protein